MHEFSVARLICRIALEEARRANAGRVTAVCVEIGVMRQIVPQLLRTAFELTSNDTRLEDAELELRTIPVTIQCLQCGQSAQCDHLQMHCGFCGSQEVQITGGNDMFVRSIRIAEEVSHEYHRTS